MSPERCIENCRRYSFEVNKKGALKVIVNLFTVAGLSKLLHTLD